MEERWEGQIRERLEKDGREIGKRERVVRERWERDRELWERDERESGLER